MLLGARHAQALTVCIALELWHLTSRLQTNLLVETQKPGALAININQIHPRLFPGSWTNCPGIVCICANSFHEVADECKINNENGPVIF